MELAPAAEELRRRVRAWARGLHPGLLATAGEAGRLPDAVLRGLMNLGLQRAPFPAEAGGSGLGATAYGAGLQELAAVDSSLAATVMASVSAAMAVHRVGGPSQRDRWLAPILRGDGLAAIALSEPRRGSDLSAVAAELIPQGPGGWRLSGEKRFITNAASPLLRVVVTLARCDAGICSLALDAGAPGMTVAGPLASIGWGSAALGDISFLRCPVPAEALLGPPGRGLADTLAVLTYGRVAVAAIGAGLAAGAWESALIRARQAGPGGRSGTSHDAVRRHLADMWCRAVGAQLMAREAASACDAGEPPRRLAAMAAMAKLAASEAAVANARAALQVFGSDGARRGGAVARLWGDAKALEIAEGTSEVQRLVLGRALDGLRFDPPPLAGLEEPEAPGTPPTAADPQSSDGFAPEAPRS